MPRSKKPHDPDVAPELDAQFFAEAENIASPEALSVYIEEHAKAHDAALAAVRKGRGKQRAPTKQLVSLRLSQNVLEAYRSTGTGWQSRIDRDLQKVAPRRVASMGARSSRGMVGSGRPHLPGVHMAKNERTSPSVASKASKILSSSSSSKAAKSVAASALTQTANKGGKGKK